jgi:hypothetical protein
MRESYTTSGGTAVATATAPSSTPDAPVRRPDRKTKEQVSASYRARLAQIADLERFARCSDRD